MPETVTKTPEVKKDPERGGRRPSHDRAEAPQKLLTHFEGLLDASGHQEIRTRGRAQTVLAQRAQLGDVDMPYHSLLGTSMLQPAVERHTALITDSYLAQPVNVVRRSRILNRLQQTYGNGHVQRVMDLVQGRREKGPVDGHGGARIDEQAARQKKLAPVFASVPSSFRENISIADGKALIQNQAKPAARPPQETGMPTLTYRLRLVPSGRHRSSSPSRDGRRTLIQMRRTAYYVVRDRNLSAGAGAQFVWDLPAMRDHLVSNVHIQGPWTLIISIHGAENILGLPPREGRPRVQYRAADIRRIFGTAAFRAWRTAEGPARVVLNACQVTSDFETVVINMLTREGTAGQPAQGLGAGCRPFTESFTVEGISARAAFDSLPRTSAQRRRFLTHLATLNTRWGYFGAPPLRPPAAAAAPILGGSEFGEEVLGGGEELGGGAEAAAPAPPSGGGTSGLTPLQELLVSYYFEEPPLGRWPVVRVMVPIARVPASDREAGEFQNPDDATRWVTNIPFYSRAQCTRFNRICGEHIPTVREGAPPPASRMTVRED